MIDCFSYPVIIFSRRSESPLNCHLSAAGLHCSFFFCRACVIILSSPRPPVWPLMQKWTQMGFNWRIISWSGNIWRPPECSRDHHINRVNQPNQKPQTSADIDEIWKLSRTIIRPGLRALKKQTELSCSLLLQVQIVDKTQRRSASPAAVWRQNSVPVGDHHLAQI